VGVHDFHDCLGDGRVRSVTSSAGPSLVQHRLNSLDAAGRLTGVTTRAIDAASQTRVAARAGYLLDRTGRRTRLTREDGTHWVYGYNKLGEVTSARKHLPDGTVLKGQEFEYAYDGIGNRTTAKYGGGAGGLRTISYAPDKENNTRKSTIPAFTTFSRSPPRARRSP